MIGAWLVFTAAAWGLARLFVPRGLEMLRTAGFLRPNFRGQAVPIGAGIVIVFPYAAVLIAADVAPGSPSRLPGALLFAVVAMGFVGFVDDVLGDKSAQGLKGHLRLMLKGRLTTGGLKAVFGGLAGLGAASALTEGAVELAVGAAFVALSANAVNLLDLRPGRALKGAAFLAVILAGFSTAREVWLCTLPLWAIVAVYAPYDLHARAMMGDAGANAVGAAVGTAAVAALSPRALTAALVALAALHAWAERASVSAAVERIPMLRWVDELGRR